ncbi:MAG TPA: hypothetical protein DCY20_02750 [Firmicutes bacterium]|nr:hypothetical protein [Bacillota bacterium]
MVTHKEKGFVLFDCLISLIILTVVICSFLTVLPVLFKVQKDMKLDHEVKTNLYAIKHQLLDGQLAIFTEMSLNSPVAQIITNSEKGLCTTYTRRDGIEKTYCLPS